MKRKIALVLAILALLCAAFADALLPDDLSVYSDEEILQALTDLQIEADARGLILNPTSTRSMPDADDTVYATKTGSKYHKSPTCSGMNDPMELTLSEAEEMGYTPCKRCY